MGTIAVTGGAGFVGTNLVRALLNLNYEVKVLDDFSTGLTSNLKNIDCQIQELSLVDAKKVRAAVQDCDYIFHLGARGSVPRSIKNPRATMDVNVMGTLNILESARETGACVAFSSSSSVYGSNTFMPKNEKMWTSPLTPYAASKLSGEALITSYAQSFDINAITYRFFNVFGPWQRPDHDYAAVIPKWIWKLMHNHKIEVYGDGNQSRDFTYIDTVTSTLIEGMKKRMKHPNPINLAFGSRITLNQCIDELRLKFPNLTVDFLPERAGDVKDSQNDPSLIKTLFPTIEPVSFSNAIEKTYQWFQDYGLIIANGPKVLD
jgi:UDP-glucose 4-epimerase